MRVLACLLSVLFLAAACAASPDGGPRPVTGTAGPVTWEVIDVGRIERADGREMRWSYTVVLREIAGTPIQFERFERGARSPSLATGGIARRPFNRRLGAKSELRDHAVDTWGWVSSAGVQFGGLTRLGSLSVERRYIGKDASGQTIVVSVRFELHPGFGHRSRQPTAPDPPLPPARSLQLSDLAGLAGRWEGYIQTGGYQVPLEMVIRANGSAEFAENDPITNRFQRSLTIRDGRLVHVGQDSVELVLRQEGQVRMLIGRYTLAPSGSAPPEILLMRLVWRGGPTSAPTAQGPLRRARL